MENCTNVDSDNEVCWGPITLDEVKWHLSLPPTKITHRHSDFGTFPEVSDPKLTEQQSQYFTADNTMATETEVGENRNELFLSKLTQVIDEKTAGDTSYETARNDTLMKITDSHSRDSFISLDEIKQRLVENTIIEDSILEISEEEVIEISDSSSCSEYNLEPKIEPENDVPDLDNNLSEMTFADNSNISEASNDSDLTFNDTLEEMQMALLHGFDYTMPNDENDRKQDLKTLQPSNRYDSVVSPVAEYIRGRSPLPTFKKPKPVVKLTPKPVHKNFKNIVSPVGVYIKNSPAPVLRQNVNSRTVTKLTVPSTSGCSSNKENCDSVIPFAIYRPAKQTVLVEKNKSKLPMSIKKLVPNCKVYEHQARPGLNESAIKDIMENCNDITGLNLSELDNAVSFIAVKDGLIE